MSGARFRSGRPFIAAAGLALLAVAACAHPGPPPAAPLVPPTAAEIPPADALPGTFTVRQKIQATSAKGGGSFEAVLQKRPGKLTLLGLTPYGSRAFLLEQTGATIQFTSYIPRDLPFPPNFVLLDIHRVLDSWLGPPPPGGEGERADRRQGEQVHERWHAGHISERIFTRAAADPPGAITATYQGDGPAGLPAHVKLVNARLGYEIVIDTLAAP
jgi:hypothetical protein